MTLDTQKLRPLFAEWARVMQENKPMLTELDSVVGDGDLGLTMSDGFAAANDVVQHSEERDIGRFFYLAGKAMASAVPSTMGTLMASGLMQAGKIFKGRTTLVTEDASAFFQAWYDGVQQRGKAQPGEKDLSRRYGTGAGSTKKIDDNAAGSGARGAAPGAMGRTADDNNGGKTWAGCYPRRAFTNVC